MTATPSPTSRHVRSVLLVLITMLTGIIALSVGGLAVAWAMLSQPSPDIPHLLAADTQLYATLSPTLGDLPNLGRLRQALPELFNDPNGPQHAGALEALLGMDLDKDVAPWAGQKVAVAVRGLSLDDLATLSDLPTLLTRPGRAQVALIIAARDERQAQAFLDAQRARRAAAGADFRAVTHRGVTVVAEQGSAGSRIHAFALVRGHVVFASTPEIILAMAEREPQGDATLHANPHFQAVVAALPPDRLGFAYVEGPALGALLRTASAEAAPVPGACLCAQQLITLAEHADVLHGAGLSLSVVDAGLRLDLTSAIDRERVSDANFAQLTAPAAPLPERLAAVSDAMLGAVSFRIPSLSGADLNLTIDPTGDGTTQAESIEAALGIDLEEDLLSWFHGEATLALFPGEGNVLVSYYLALRVEDRAAAERGMRKLMDGLAQAWAVERGVEPLTLNGVPFQVIDTGEGLLGYGFVGDELVLGFGRSVLAAAAGDTPLLADHAGYQTGMEALPTRGGAALFVNPVTTGELLSGMGAMGEALASRLAPFDALVVSIASGADRQGVARSTLLLVIADGP